MIDIVDRLQAVQDAYLGLAGARISAVDLRDAKNTIKALREDLNRAMGIVAVIHRDGGHRAAEVGDEQAIAEAHEKWAKLMQAHEEMLPLLEDVALDMFRAPKPGVYKRVLAAIKRIREGGVK